MFLDTELHYHRLVVVCLRVHGTLVFFNIKTNTICIHICVSMCMWREQAIIEWFRRVISADTRLWTIEHNDQRARRVIMTCELCCSLPPRLLDSTEQQFGHATNQRRGWKIKFGTWPYGPELLNVAKAAFQNHHFTGSISQIIVNNNRCFLLMFSS